MSFSGKSTYSAGVELPEISEDVSDLVSVLSPTETPLLDLLGEPTRSVRSTLHEWIEESTAPVQANIQEINNGGNVFTLGIDHTLFRVGELCRVDPWNEVVRITAINTTTGATTVQRDVEGRGEASVVEPATLVQLSAPTLEGAAASAARFGTRRRAQNFTQIFTSTVELSGSLLAVRSLGVRDEMEFQKSHRLRELLRSLEASVINGVASDSASVGNATSPRSMRGIVSFIESNRINASATGYFDPGALDEDRLNKALRALWNNGSTNVDTIVVGGREKRAINAFISGNRKFAASTETYKDLVSTYESDFGVCRVVMSRHLPPRSALLLDSSRVEVLPLAGRSFHFKKLAPTGDSECGQVIGEYTLEVRNEAAHAFIYNLG